jgi:hypothetical protein
VPTPIDTKKEAMRVAPHLTLLLLVAGCVSRPAPPPPPAPVPVIPAAPAPAPVAKDWIDRPLTPGDWTYGRMSNESRASYGDGVSAPVFSLSCDISAGSVIAARPGQFEDGVTGGMVLTTTTGSKTFPAANDPTGQVRVISRIAAVDPQLDAIAFSRGRFMVAVKGGGELILPTWPEIARVIEDCRR